MIPQWSQGSTTCLLNGKTALHFFFFCLGEYYHAKVLALSHGGAMFVWITQRLSSRVFCNEKKQRKEENNCHLGGIEPTSWLQKNV